MPKLCYHVNFGKITAAAIVVNTSTGVGFRRPPSASFNSAWKRGLVTVLWLYNMIFVAFIAAWPRAPSCESLWCAIQKLVCGRVAGKSSPHAETELRSQLCHKEKDARIKAGYSNHVALSVISCFYLGGHEVDKWRFGKLSSSSIDLEGNGGQISTFIQSSRLKRWLESCRRLQKDSGSGISVRSPIMTKS